MKKRVISKEKRRETRHVGLPLISEEQIRMIERAMLDKQTMVQAIMGEEAIMKAIDGMRKVISETNQLIMVENVKNDLVEALKRIK